MRLGIEFGQQSHKFFLIDFAGDVLAQGGGHPAGDLRIFQSLGRDYRPDDDLAAGLGSFGPGLEAVELSLCFGNLLVNGTRHVKSFRRSMVAILTTKRVRCKSRSAHLYKRYAFVWAKGQLHSPLIPKQERAEMAIYHLRATMISRSAGRSATAAAAYRTAERIEDHRTGLTFDYRARGGVDHVETLAPANAPAWVQDRAALGCSVSAPDGS